MAGLMMANSVMAPRTALRTVANVRAPAAARSAGLVVRAERASWLPGYALPEYLKGEMPGDFGFDPLKLGEDSCSLSWYRQAELQNGRWAMLGAAGILVEDLFGHIGAGGPAAQTPWYDAGKYNYFAPATSLFVVQMILFAWVEFRRWQDMMKPGSANQDPIFSQYSLPSNEPGYPGGIFDPLGFSKTNVEELKLKEIKNGRLAMLGFAGFLAQHQTTGKTPLTNLAEHLADPWGQNVFTLEHARIN